MSVNKLVSIVKYILLIAAISLTAFLLFYRLGDTVLMQTDEATHGINVHEMLKSGDYIVNTLKYKVDYYNSKPPLSLWALCLSYSMFGENTLALRIPSAVCGLIICILISIYLLRRYGINMALAFALVFPTGGSMFTFHMFRAGDMDSIYGLFFTICMLGMWELIRFRSIESEEQNTDSELKKCHVVVLIIGISLGLAILTKGLHAAMIVMLALILLPMMWNNIRKTGWRWVLASAGICVAIVLAWAIPRYFRDGWAFIYKGTFGEAEDKTQTFMNFEIIKYNLEYMWGQWTFRLLAYLLIAAMGVFLLNSLVVHRGSEVTDYSSIHKKIIFS